jgi:uncharacterized damage-inducible protein DinB
MINKYAHYNLWANRKLTELLVTIDDERLNQLIISSFKSIRETVYHIWDAETIWLERLSNNEISSWPPSKIYNLETPLNILINSSENLLKLIENASPNFLEIQTSYKDSKGNQYSTNNEEILHHVFNHSTLHRGQIITLLRQIGITQIPSTDFITYIRFNS